MSVSRQTVNNVVNRLSEHFVRKAEFERLESTIQEDRARGFLSATNAGSYPKRRYSICKLLWGSVNGFGRRAHVDDGYEREIFDDLHQKALSAGADSAGGFLVPEEFRTDLIARLKERVAVRQALESDGASPIPMVSDTLKVARGAGSVVASYVAENVDAALQDPTTEQVTLSLKDLIVATQLSNKLVELSNPEADEFVERRLREAIVEKEDIVFLRADGSPAEEPTGLLNLVDAGQKFNSTGAGGAILIEDLLTAERLLLDANINPPFQWIFNAKAWAKLRGLKDGDGRPIFDPDFSNEAFGRLTPLGYPVFVSSQIPSNLGASSDRTEIYLVKGSQILVGQSTDGPAISASKEFKFLADALVVKAVMRHDIQLAHGKGLAVIENVLAV